MTNISPQKGPASEQSDHDEDYIDSDGLTQHDRINIQSLTLLNQHWYRGTR